VKKAGPYLILLLLLAACFSLATILQPRVSGWSKRGQSDSVLNVLFGDGRRLFANHFFVQADVSFHSGYYPSIFDQAGGPKDTRHLTAKEGEPAAEEHEKQFSFLGPPRDWVERFGRHFVITSHTHLEGKNEREILPWLKMSAKLDPQKVETYTVSAYWLRDLGKAKEAEEFLREGLRNNPESYEILFELGRLYSENYHDPARARNVWELALRRWTEQQAAGKKPDLLQLDQIAVYLSRLEEHQENLARAMELLQLAKKASPNPQALQPQIDELKRKLAATPLLPTAQAH
jgi:tetratricopeptide (TPR) repeat protein